MLRLIKKLMNRSDQTSSKFAINSTLLGDPNTLAWSNLGFWHAKSSESDNHAPINYITACENLAHVVGDAAHLHNTDHVLDLGCGQGASLHYWHTTFGVQHITAFEIQSTCIANIQQAALKPLDAIYQASFSQLPLPAAQLYHAFDAVLCVDAAYHASLNDFLAVNQAALTPQGRMAFTCLIRPANSKKSGFLLGQLKKYFNKPMFELTSVPQQHLYTEQDLIQLLSSFDFIDIQIKHLDQPVLAGFAQYIQQQPPAFSTGHMAAWLKITITAKLCRFLYQHQLLHYSVVSATYMPSGI